MRGQGAFSARALLTILAFSPLLLAFLSASSFSHEGSVQLTYQLLDETVKPGSESTVFLTLTNPTAFGVRKVKLEFEAGEYINLDRKEVEVGNIPANSFQQTSVNFAIDETARATTSYINVKITYFVDSTTEEKSVTIPIKIVTVPQLQLVEARFNASEIKPGDVVKLSVTLVNKGDGSAKDLMLTLNSSKLFITLDSPERFVSELSPGKSFQSEFTVLINPSVEAGVYSIPILLRYLDETKSVAYREVKSVGMKVEGEYEVLVSLESQRMLCPGCEGELEIKVVNKGGEEVRFLTLSVEKKAPFVEVFPSTVYVGNLESDDYSTERLRVRVSSEAVTGKEYELPLKLSYEDAYGKKFDREVVLRVKVTGIEERSEFQTPTSWIIASVTLAILSYFLGRKSVKK